MAKPLVAIVGRPNVGKSMLFNKLTGQRTSIVEDTPGVTRDQSVCGSCDWCGRTILSGGHRRHRAGNTGQRDARNSCARQAELGIELADADAIVVVDVTCAQASPRRIKDVAAMLLQFPASPLVARREQVRTAVGRATPGCVTSSTAWAWATQFAASALHGHGTGDLLDWAVWRGIPPQDSGRVRRTATLSRVAVVGKPNVGKSCLSNRILGEERVIVCDVAGTTRDAVDS